MKGKWRINFIIDAAMFLLMMSIAGVGLLMRFVLLSGREAMLKYGERVDLYFLGLGRHQWGTVHLLLSLAFLTLLALHLILHWGMIVGLFIFPPFGLFLGGFIGAMAGELWAGKKGDEALKAGLGVFIGTLFATGLKFGLCGVMLFFYVREMF